MNVRYDYEASRWNSEFGWEYRTNDVSTIAANGIAFPEGDYAANTFYINGRYRLNEGQRLTPWVGAGLRIRVLMPALHSQYAASHFLPDRAVNKPTPSHRNACDASGNNPDLHCRSTIHTADACQRQ